MAITKYVPLWVHYCKDCKDKPFRSRNGVAMSYMCCRSSPKMSPDACLDFALLSTESKALVMTMILRWCREEVSRLHTGLALDESEDKLKYVLHEKKDYAVVRIDNLINMALFLGVLR